MQFNDILRKQEELERFPASWKWRVSSDGNICLCNTDGRRTCSIDIGRSENVSLGGPATVSVTENGRTTVTKCTVMDLLTRKLIGFSALSSLDRKLAREQSLSFDPRLLALQGIAHPDMSRGGRA